MLFDQRLGRLQQLLAVEAALVHVFHPLDFDQAGLTSEDYSRKLTGATGIHYPPDGHLADMDPGFYSADYLRAWIRHAQLRSYLISEVGDDWWRDAKTGEILRALFSEGTRPSSEEIATRLGFQPYDTAPLIAELTT